jgi:2-polyprenyl-3-methyl-5-hydroxy-6-metoxy-1,4-benzoquinol methylase
MIYDKAYFQQFDWIVPKGFETIVAPHILGKNVVDVGCAIGTLGEEIKKYANLYLGIEIAEYCFSKLVDANLNCVITSEKSLFNLKGFDVACVFDVIEHLTDEEIANLLDRLPSELIISTPTYETPDETHINIKKYLDWKIFFNYRGYDFSRIGEFVYPEPDGTDGITMIFHVRK